ncbi:MAG: hypothetical protein O7F71_10085 [Gammaproteobacteria bacterium]|nr:hypothetical protein [Gammaproteobacteria bacterium]
MTNIKLAPYFHPTTVCFVDDNESFLRSLDLDLPAGWAYRTFVDPLEALSYLNEKPPRAPLAERCFSVDDANHSLIHVDFNLIEQEINFRERFRQISVVVVDYSMPSINGLDFCDQVTDPYIRKVMLTGVADEKVAVEAFNAGLIHRFIPKNHPKALETIINFVNELEQEYFSQYRAPLQSSLAINPPGFLVDEAVAVWFHALIDSEHVVEYYFVTEPPGFLLLRGNGSMLRAIILDDAQMAAQQEYAAKFNAPAEVLRAIGNKERLGVFDGDSPAHYFGNETFPWEENLLDVTPIAGRRTWYVGIHFDPPMDIDFDPEVASYDAYLNKKDGK